MSEGLRSRRIQDMHRRFIAGKGFPLPWPEEPEHIATSHLYEPVPGTSECVIVDIDGTVALRGARSPFDETQVSEDMPNFPVAELVELLHGAGIRVIFVSGRKDSCREATRAWLDAYFSMPYELHMRRDGDGRKDYIVKREIFDEHIRHRYTVRWVLDDRDQVVRMWREELGLTCLQVAPGGF
jgi:hypothetical protein